MRWLASARSGLQNARQKLRSLEAQEPEPEPEPGQFLWDSAGDQDGDRSDGSSSYYDEFDAAPGEGSSTYSVAPSSLARSEPAAGSRKKRHMR